jgi:tetrapyrrole methylase family protein / MazG family protein
MNKPEKTPVTLQDLKALMARLRGEGGCPWDRRQNTKSLKIYLLEETYELVDALDRRATAEVKEELGDLLFQIVFLSRVFEEQGDFSLDQVIEGIHRKMVRRHPHIFGDTKWEKAEQVVQGWQEIKTQEKNGQDPFESIPAITPSLLKAHRISQRAAGLGFDWPHITAVLEKVSEELKEMEEALQAGNTVAAEEELGDLLFTLVNLARFMGITAENALRITIQKFLARFRLMISNPAFRGRQAEPLSLEAWETLWQESKTQHSEICSKKRQKENGTVLL